jgi:4-carboxymuconolactone decarboxylase
MDLKELYQRGLELRRRMFGREAVDKRMAALGPFGAPLQTVINAYTYGDVWGRGEIPLKTRSLVTLAITAATSRTDETRVHVRGALANGCTPQEIREVLLQVAMYCGVPASLQAHHIALEVFAEKGIAVTDA